MKRERDIIDIDLFAGGGGLAVGLRLAGFAPACFFEQDEQSCATLTTNAAASGTLLGSVHKENVREFDWCAVERRVRLLAAGAPCQPFSLAGKHLAYADGRNLFPEVTRAMRCLQPEAVLIENVRGLARTAFAPYFEYILRCLECPSEEPRKNELWQNHNERIRTRQRSPAYVPDYNVVWRVLDAADYGVPQNRVRVLIVATRSDKAVYKFPNPTHSKIKLEQSQRNGSYWKKHSIRKRKNGVVIDEQTDPKEDEKLPWVTVREAIRDLPEPANCERKAMMNHWRIVGARPYPGHDGSALDWPSKTIKAGVHGVPGGENTLKAANGLIRYYTLRETARLQTFPDDHYFEGARIHITRQIGNAVPCKLASIIATPLFELLNDHNQITKK
jgi:DNA (cytosine-5)-methyltransferase 1